MAAVESVLQPVAPFGLGSDDGQPGTKKEQVLSLLRRPKGATVAAIMEATGWQAHSVRGFFTSVVRQKLGLELTSVLETGTRIYRVVTPKPTQARSIKRKTTPATEARA